MGLTNWARHVSLETLADLQVPKELHISPDGQRVVYTLESISKKHDHAVSSLWVAEIGVQNSARQITSGVFKDELPQWSTDGKYVAFISDRAERGRSSAIYLLPITAVGGEAYPITETRNTKNITTYAWSPNGAYIAFLCEDEKSPEQKRKEEEKDDVKVYGTDWATDWNYQRLRLIDVERRKVSILTQRNEHVKAFSWKGDSSEIVYTAQQTPDTHSADLHGTRIEIVSLKTGAIRNFIKVPGPISSLVWASPDTIYFIAGLAPPHSSASTSVYEARIKKKQWGSWFGWGGHAVALYRAGDCVVARVQDAKHDEAHALGGPGGNWPFSSFFKSALGITAFDSWRSPSSHSFILAMARSSPASANEVWSVDVNSSGGNEQGYIKLSSHNKAFDASGLSRAKHITAKAADGHECDGWLFRPNSISTHEPLPTVVLLQGPPYRSIQSFHLPHNLEVPLLTSAGYAVLCPNYRGSSAHVNTPPKEILTAGYSDITAILQKAIAMMLVNRRRVGIGGWSQGASLATFAATKGDFPFRAVVSGSGDINLDEFMISDYANRIDTNLPTGTPWKVSNRSRKNTTDRRSSHPEKPPILILHGEENEQAPVSQAIGLWRGCQRWKVPVELVLYPRETHLIRERRHMIDMWQRVRQFYGLHLK